QGIVQSFSVFIDTAIICTATALIILIAGMHEQSSVDNGVVLTQLALQSHVGPWGQTFVSAILTLFAFSSILYNFYLGENSSSWLTPGNPVFFIVFRVLMLVLSLWGSMQDLATVFSFADLTMALLAVFNLVALALLMKVAFRLMNDDDQQWRAGKVPVFDPDKFPDLDLDREAWNDAAEAVDRARK